MPYRFQPDPELFQIEFYGTLTPDDLRALANELASAEVARDVVPDRLTVLEEVTEITLRGEDLRDVVTTRKATRFPNRFRSAIVASRAAAVGYARMFQLLNDHPQITIALFPAVEAAHDWLQSSKGLGR
jgi:hypothetical protein